MNDFVYVSKLLKCILFMDDTTLFYSLGKSNMGAAQQETKKKILIFGKSINVYININGIGIIRAKGNKGLDVRVVNLIWKSHKLYFKKLKNIKRGCSVTQSKGFIRYWASYIIQ